MYKLIHISIVLNRRKVYGPEGVIMCVDYNSVFGAAQICKMTDLILNLVILDIYGALIFLRKDLLIVVLTSCCPRKVQIYMVCCLGETKG
jgi:hypothetical protein